MFHFCHDPEPKELDTPIPEPLRGLQDVAVPQPKDPAEPIGVGKEIVRLRREGVRSTFCVLCLHVNFRCRIHWENAAILPCITDLGDGAKCTGMVQA